MTATPTKWFQTYLHYRSTLNVLIICATVVACVIIHGRMNRYEPTGAEGTFGTFDKWTGFRSNRLDRSWDDKTTP